MSAVNKKSAYRRACTNMRILFISTTSQSLGDDNLHIPIIQLSGLPNYPMPLYNNHFYRLAVSNKTKETNNANPKGWTFLFDQRRYIARDDRVKILSESFKNFGNFSIYCPQRPQKCCSVHSLIFPYGSEHGSEWFSLIFPFCGTNFSPIKTAIYAEKHPVSRRNRVRFWLRRQDSNLRPPGYEPDELPTALLRDMVWVREVFSPGGGAPEVPGYYNIGARVCQLFFLARHVFF